jgi:hypothetical protein
MHFHLPKPLHGWRAFIGEVGVIVLGVLIALGAEQAVEAVHDRFVAAESRSDVRDEVAFDLGFWRSRLMESACIASRLSQLSKIVEQGTVAKGAVRWVGRPNVFAPFTERWRAVTSTARTALFPADEQGRLDAIYGLFGALSEGSQAEQEAWTTLDVLRRLNGPIDAPTRLALRKALAQAQRTDDDFHEAGYWAFFHARALSIQSSPETTLKPGDLGRDSICLPLSTTPEQAAKLLQPGPST